MTDRGLAVFFQIWIKSKKEDKHCFNIKIINDYTGCDNLSSDTLFNFIQCILYWGHDSGTSPKKSDYDVFHEFLSIVVCDLLS